MNIEQYHWRRTKRRYHWNSILLALAVLIVLAMALQTYFSFRPRAHELLKDFAQMQTEIDILWLEVEELKDGAR